ncbi:MAG: glycerate kinase, partial [Elusimicrobiota bacterium]
FKGSLSCVDAARAMARGVRAALKGAKVVSIPIADGGDGLIDALRVAMGGKVVSARVRGPLGERRRAAYLWVGAQNLAVIEMARASGLALVPVENRRPLDATSRGVGDLMRDAVRRGARTIIVGMGGTASSDGGAGMASALGARLLDAAGRDLPDGAEALLRLARVETEASQRLLAGVSISALADVTNPLLGHRGSAAIFGPQKGASKSEVRLIERALTRWAAILARDTGARVAGVRAAGAAGGLGAGLLAFARAEIVPGAQWVLENTGALKALKNCDLALSAEGRLDKTSLYGKAPVALARAAKKAGVPCVAIAGQVEVAVFPFQKIVSFSDAGAQSVNDSMLNAAKWAGKAAAMAVSGLAVFAVLNVPARADMLASAQAFDAQYFQRNSGDNLQKNIEGLEGILRSEVTGEGELWKAGYLWRLCRAKVRRGETLTEKSKKLLEYSSARRDCEKSVALFPQTADAHFWLGVGLGRWAETKGMMKALFTLGTIKKEMAATLKIDPRHGGAHHVLAEILWQTPGIAGGDKKKALAQFELAVKLSPTNSENYLPLAEAYLRFDRKEDAVKILKAVAAIKDPADPAEYPDNLVAAKTLLLKLEAGR